MWDFFFLEIFIATDTPIPTASFPTHTHTPNTRPSPDSARRHSSNLSQCEASGLMALLPLKSSRGQFALNRQLDSIYWYCWLGFPFWLLVVLSQILQILWLLYGKEYHFLNEILVNAETRVQRQGQSLSHMYSRTAFLFMYKGKQLFLDLVVKVQDTTFGDGEFPWRFTEQRLSRFQSKQQVLLC